MLQIRLIMNSPVEEILAFRTCCGIRSFDQNLEILIKNIGDREVKVQSCLDLKGETGEFRIETLMPSGLQMVLPGETIAFYCYLDESRWEEAGEAVFYDADGGTYRVEIH